MSKTGTDGRREPPQTAVVILTALPLSPTHGSGRRCRDGWRICRGGKYSKRCRRSR